MYPFNKCYFCDSQLKSFQYEIKRCDNYQCKKEHDYSVFCAANYNGIYVECVSFIIDDLLIETSYNSNGKVEYQRIFENYCKVTTSYSDPIHISTGVMFNKFN